MDMFHVKGKEGNGNSRQVWGKKGLMNETETECSVPALAYWDFTSMQFLY